MTVFIANVVVLLLISSGGTVVMKSEERDKALPLRNLHGIDNIRLAQVIHLTMKLSGLSRQLDPASHYNVIIIERGQRSRKKVVL